MGLFLCYVYYLVGMKRMTMNILFLFIITVTDLATATTNKLNQKIEADDQPQSPILTDNSNITLSNYEGPLNSTRQKKIRKCPVIFT